MVEIDDTDIRDIADGLKNIADSIRPRNTTPGRDATGGTIDSLTEAVMGLTAAMCRIADAIESVAAAISKEE